MLFYVIPQPRHQANLLLCDVLTVANNEKKFKAMVIFKSTLPSLVVSCSVCGSKIIPGSRLATCPEVKGSEQRAGFLEKREHFWKR